MKKADGIIIAALLFVCAAGFLSFPLGHGEQAPRIRAEIYVEGKLAQTVNLPETETRELEIDDGAMLLNLERDGVSVSCADCPTHTCVRTGKITRPGQMIACLPNRVIIKLADYEGLRSEVDVIAE